MITTRIRLLIILLVLGELKSNYQMLHFCIIRGFLFFRRRHQ